LDRRAQPLLKFMTQTKKKSLASLCIFAIIEVDVQVNVFNND